MIRLLLEPVNLLILDEPTNHLDMGTKDILKQAIKNFDGTVIVVSHDREFLDGLVEKVYEFGGGKVRECLGGIYEFLEKKKLASLQELERKNPKSIKAPQKENLTQQVQPKENSIPATRLTYAEQRERDKMLRRAAKKVEEAEAQIAVIEEDIAAIEAKIGAGDIENDIFTLHSTRNRDLETAMSLWELASQELDELKERFQK
jgi:ABC transporter, ATP-binding protein